jgi:hypothetical protein
LSRDEVQQYLALAFTGHEFPDELAAALHARTEGNPLFMVDLLRYLRDRGVIVQDHDRWTLVRALPDLQRELPQSVRSDSTKVTNSQAAADCSWHSVQGAEFDCAVAEILGQEPDVEERLRFGGAFLRPHSRTDFSDD